MDQKTLEQIASQVKISKSYTNLEQYPVFSKAVQVCVLVAHKTKNFPKMFKYDLGVRANSFATEMLVCVMEGLSFPITKIQEKIKFFGRALDCLKYIGGILVVANCLNCITDIDKGTVDESLGDVAVQLRKTICGLKKRLEIEDNGATTK